MDQKRIGAFIAQSRKEKNLTQMQLAERLAVTGQAVSKWENGKGMPDVSLLQPLCDALDISLNELFLGERITAEEAKQMTDLRPVKYVSSIFANVALSVAAIELTVGLVGRLEAMLINASVWLLMALVLIGKLTYDKRKLKKLKCSGVCVDPKIEDIIPAQWIRVGNYVTVRIACSFIYEGREYRVKSGCYCLTPFLDKGELSARVYIDKKHPERYSVELLQTGGR